jgi:hypothetical protein
MSALWSDRTETDRQAAIETIASETANFSDSTMLQGGGVSFRQQAYCRYGANMLITSAGEVIFTGFAEMALGDTNVGSRPER